MREVEFIRKEGIQKDRLQVQEQDGVYFLTFPALSECAGIRHLFTTRLGGVSEGIYAEMNLSYTRGDRKEAVDENYRRIAAILGCRVSDIVCSDQTHTANIRIVGEADKGKGIIRRKEYADVDGLVTNERGIALATFYADCVPVYFVDPVKGVIGLAHSGWRGTVQKISGHMIEKMRKEYGCAPADILVCIGPSICQSCYEVSRDVREEFLQAFTGEQCSSLFLPGKEEGKYQLDLWQAILLSLTQAGVSREHVTVTDLCTCCNPDLLFSHRASEGKRGNLGAFLMLEPEKDQMRAGKS